MDSNLVYRDELVANGRQGVVSIALLLTESGQVVTMRPRSSDVDPELTGWVLTVVQKALDRPLEGVKSDKAFQAAIEVRFRITHPYDLRPPPMISIIGNTIHLEREGKAPARESVAVQDVNRAEWDLIYRQREAINACENRRASGACLIAGKIAMVLGETSNAERWLTMACEEGIDEACLLP
ncbi:MAG: hypothetical protein AAB250_13820 [Bdellovibrionota bacterium]